MNKNKKNMQSGFSIVMVVVALGIVAAGTNYIISLNKKNQVASSVSRSTSLIEAERRRVSGVLSDNNTCKLPGNFGGAAPVRANISGLVVANGSALITKNNMYFNGALPLVDISTVQKIPNNSKGYELVLTYRDSTTNNERSAFIGKKQTQIRIPMYMKVEAGVVVDCYTISENKDLDQAITNSCSPSSTIAVENKNSVLHYTIEGAVADCKRNIVFDTNPTSSNPYTTCATNTPDYRFMSGIKIAPVSTAVDAGNSIVFESASLCGNILGVGASSTQACTATQIVHSMTNNALTCNNPGASARDADGGSPLCGAGQLLFWNSTAATTCVTVDCTSIPNNFLQKISGGVVTCFKVESRTCPAGQYISGFDGSGVPKCEDLPIVSGTCASQYGTAVSRDTSAGAGGNLTCSSGVTVTKNCSASPTTFAYELTPSGANCTTY